VAEDESGWDRRRTALLARYERVAWELFAQRGFGTVTVDDIAAAAHVSARTLFRYFPTKEDFLLGFPRRGTQRFVDRLATLAPSPTPLEAAWQSVRTFYLDEPPDSEGMVLWREAAADAPEIHARVRGERIHSLTEALADYCAASLGTDALSDPRPRLLAGVIVGVEASVIELWGRSSMSVREILDTAEQVVPGLAGATTTALW
jgi:AcrR family transcriptional regulator